MIDVTQGSLPAVLPFLKQTHALSYAQAAMIVLAANLTSSIIQPLFGYLSDQLARRWILPVSVFVSGAGIALVGLAPGYSACSRWWWSWAWAWPPGIPRVTRRRPAWRATARRRRCRGSRSAATSASRSGRR